MTTLDVFTDSRGIGRCKGCGAPIVWAELVKTGKRMPFEADVTVVSSRRDLGTRREIQAFDINKTHWATCPQRDRFKQPKLGGL